MFGKSQNIVLQKIKNNSKKSILNKNLANTSQNMQCLHKSIFVYYTISYKYLLPIYVAINHTLLFPKLPIFVQYLLINLIFCMFNNCIHIISTDKQILSRT